MNKFTNMILADFHLHSKYSRATSPLMNIIDLGKAAKEKGINLLGTGDFTHPMYFAELKKNLTEFNEGIFIEEKSRTKFILTTEICLIFSKEINKVRKIRKIHLLVFAKNFEIAEQINDWLSKVGNLKADGRPTFGMNAVEFTEKIIEISRENFIVPAHCLLPNTLIHTNLRTKKIEEINENDMVLTHKGIFKKVTKIFKRNYQGGVYKIIPWYFIKGLTTTPEHPFFALKSVKKCSWTKGTCRPLCSKVYCCKNKLYENYKSAWIQAKDLENGDFLMYPRIKVDKDIKEIKITDFVDCKKLENDLLIPKNSMNKKNQIKEFIKIDEHFCLLAGYYLAEGYVIRDEGIGFSFNVNEKEYIDEIKDLMSKIFGIEKFKIDNRGKNQSDIVFYSHILNEFFKKLFYFEGFRAWNKIIPEWMIFLPKEKIVEIFRGWWRGDCGYTVSRELANQMKLICLKIGIIPSISIDSAENFNKRGKHFISGRKITTQRDTIVFSNLSFFENDLGLLSEKPFKKFVNKRKTKHGWIDTNYAYLPIRKIEIQNYDGYVYNIEVEDDNSYVTEFATVHNCWTPWFGILGSKSGFDSIEECFEDKSKEIYAVETGLSSDPMMNWRISELDKYALISNSDSHSLHNLGRECNAFNFDEEKVNYQDIINAIKFKDKKKFLFTVEVPPEFGKYHYTGHRNCNFSCSPKEAINLHNICPVCHNPLTIGVEQRVEELADRESGFIPKDAIPFKNIIPLWEICEKFKVKDKEKILLGKFNNEMNVLLNAPIEELVKIDKNIANIIGALRNNKHIIKPGYDGVYGEILIEDSNKAQGGKEKEDKEKGKYKEMQKKLDEFL